MSNSRPTIRDVARLAGVSHQTVSRVMNKRENVSRETQERVDAAILELGYRPSAIARSMAHGRTHTLACISPNLTDYTFASIIEGAETEARQHGFFLLSSSAEDDESFRTLVDELVEHRRVDGLMIINPYADRRYENIPPNFPTVYVGAAARSEAVSSVCLDDEHVAYEATKHLLELGHRSVAMVTGPMEEDCSRDRSVGYRRALTDAGLPFDERLVTEGDWSASSGQSGFLGFVKNGLKPTAVFAQNDRMALGILRAARDLGLDVPAQLAVIGVDDMPLSSYFDPPLTTMRQDMPAIGQTATRLLLDIIENNHTSVQALKLPAQLIVRQSTFEKEVVAPGH
jgi:DNA-binding LacI/PurR family transcriptional regulator